MTKWVFASAHRPASSLNLILTKFDKWGGFPDVFLKNYLSFKTIGQLILDLLRSKCPFCYSKASLLKNSLLLSHRIGATTLYYTPLMPGGPRGPGRPTPEGPVFPGRPVAPAVAPDSPVSPELPGHPVTPVAPISPGGPGRPE